MPESDLAERLDAVERVLTDDETDLRDVRDRATLTAEREQLEHRISSLESTVQELEAAVEAVRGYAGNVRAVNRDVERRASAALAKAEALESAAAGPVRDHSASAAGTGRSRAISDADGRDSGQSVPRERSNGEADVGRQFGDVPAQSGRPESGHGGHGWEYEPRDAFETPDTRAACENGTTGADEPESGAGQTEQFIERIRDAL